jgi:hypothetical protein
MTSEQTQMWLTTFRNKVQSDRLLGCLHQEITDFKDSFAKFMGMGCYLFLFVDEYDESQLREIVEQRIKPYQMVELLRNVIKQFQLVVWGERTDEMNVWKFN